MDSTVTKLKFQDKFEASSSSEYLNEIVVYFQVGLLCSHFELKEVISTIHFNHHYCLLNLQKTNKQTKKIRSKDVQDVRFCEALFFIILNTTCKDIDEIVCFMWYFSFHICFSSSERNFRE